MKIKPVPKPKGVAAALALMSLAACLTARAQAQTSPSQAAPTNQPPRIEAQAQASKTEPAVATERRPTVTTRQLTKKAGLKLDGIAVRAARLGNPLQLINPFAPARYGGGETNLAFDPITRRPDGLAFLKVGL